MHYRSNIKEPNPGTLCASLDLEQKYKAATKIDRLTVIPMTTGLLSLA
jgi:uncharacterized membrane protein